MLSIRRRASFLVLMSCSHSLFCSMVSVMANKEADFDMEVAVVSSHSIAFSGCSIASWVYFLRVSLDLIPVTILILIYNLNSQHYWNKEKQFAFCYSYFNC